MFSIRRTNFMAISKPGMKRDFQMSAAAAARLHPFFNIFAFSARLREQSMRVIRACCQQCEFVIAHRARRSQQILSLYVKWWGDSRLKSIAQSVRFGALKGRRRLWYSICSLPLFSWERKRIPDEEFSALSDELCRVKLLSSNGEQKCRRENCFHCDCARCKNSADDDWSLFYSDDNLKMWRKEHVEYKGQGLYVYKVFGHFEDVAAEDFFKVQMDVNYRKEWDVNSKELYVVEAERESNSEILYWEFVFPRMFYNRDYVCNRRYKVDEGRKMITIISESVDHPSCPEKPPVHRVKEYWSHIVIKAKEEFNEPGLEFTITYFDDPGLRLPCNVSAWYTLKGMPDYIIQQKNAALLLHSGNNACTDRPNEKVPTNKKELKEENYTGEKRFLIS